MSKMISAAMVAGFLVALSAPAFAVDPPKTKADRGTVRVQTRAQGGFAVISVCDTPFRGPAGVLKRISDVVLASLILLLISPVMRLTSAIVRFGPAIRLTRTAWHCSRV